MKTKEYIKPMPATWWLHNRHLVMFMIRELTAVFVAGYAVFLLVLLYQVRPGQHRQEFRAFFENVLATPTSLVLQLVALAFVIIHSVTWFNLTPQALVLWNGDEKISPVLIAGANYGVWLIISIGILILVL